MYQNQINYIRNITDLVPSIAIVLGSGLGGLANSIEITATIPYSDIPNFPISTAPSHKGRLIFGILGGKNVVLLDGRVHMYEGYSSLEVINPIRIVKELGAEIMILTNAAGGINSEFNIGDFMLIEDHISLFVDSCLIGRNNDKLGTRFPDMSNAYDKKIRQLAKEVAVNNNISLKTGVYVQLKGPQFETPSEISLLSRLGADAVGMSTVIETIAAIHCGLKVCGISMISNMACGIYDKPLSGEEVVETANKVAPQFEKLITEIVKAL